MADTLVAEQEPTAVFEYRQPPTKRRKFLRKRASSDDEDENTPKVQSQGDGSISQNTSGGASKDEDEGLGANVSSLAELARLRKKAARSRQGLQLAVPTVIPTESSKEKDSGCGDEVSDEKREEERLKAEELARITGRFAKQTGQILDVDKHMMEYIEKRMSSKNASSTSAISMNSALSTSTPQHVSQLSSSQSNLASDGNTQSAVCDLTVGAASTSNPSSTSTDPRFSSDLQIRGATLGKLHEVDLGEEAKMRNIARTEAATRRLEGKEPIQDEEDLKGGKKKGRFKKRRRNSEDLQRDKLVEEVLKETRLELYDEVEKEEEPNDEEGATDDRIVERFRKEFMDAMNLKRGRRRPVATTKKDDKTKPRGPKLGGSRMARAAMREAQVGTTGKK
ncbi:hypothetical protein BJ508DRAFT_413258 [Ascobolus immersus RN42]|uniref:Hepatocellular carcinoma-associated antigen 59-domain-containing protein n=1 Tax=Ascobolus immersus RN42 TaxID=1160509 RepID=A0A3N4IHA8_ASCIM|nr:hypothetical protein BJ508DRAFT_413258 [Ascobolus immersus RN42]